MNKQERTEIGAQLRAQREKLQLSQEDVAETLKTQQHVISKLEAGQVSGMDMYLEYANVLGFTLILKKISAQ